MKRARLVPIVLIAAACFAKSRPGGIRALEARADAVDMRAWTTVSLQSFRFRLPPDMARAEVQGIDSFVFKYVAATGETTLDGDYGMYSNDLSSVAGPDRDVGFADSIIGGRQARLVCGRLRRSGRDPKSEPFMAGAAWREVGGRNSHLTVEGTTRDESRLPELMAILKSFEFD
jgi:hypothetical protein